MPQMLTTVKDRRGVIIILGICCFRPKTMALSLRRRQQASPSPTFIRILISRTSSFCRLPAMRACSGRLVRFPAGFGG
jgi:hypothetical protein